MAIDILTLYCFAMAAFKGYRRGLIVAIFSFLGIVIGIAAALKFSVVVAGWFQNNTNIGSQWLPFISFILVMIGCNHHYPLDRQCARSPRLIWCCWAG